MIPFHLQSTDNSLVIQSRVIMLDSFLILFTYTSILCYLRFYHQRHRYVHTFAPVSWYVEWG